jgi:hypothetical protein
LVSYLNFITLLVGSERQADAINFDVTSAFDLVLHVLLFYKLSALGFSDGSVNWFRSYLLNRQQQVRISGNISSPCQVISGVPQGTLLESLFINVYINDLCDVIKHSRYVIFAKDIKIHGAINSPEDCTLLHYDTDSI